MSTRSSIESVDEAELMRLRRELDRLAELRLEQALSERDSEAYRSLAQRETELLERLQIDLRSADAATTD